MDCLTNQCLVQTVSQPPGSSRVSARYLLRLLLPHAFLDCAKKIFLKHALSDTSCGSEVIGRKANVVKQFELNAQFDCGRRERYLYEYELEL